MSVYSRLTVVLVVVWSMSEPWQGLSFTTKGLVGELPVFRLSSCILATLRLGLRLGARIAASSESVSKSSEDDSEVS